MKPYEKSGKIKNKIWVALDLVFSLLHLDLDLNLAQNHLNNAKERKWELENKKSTSCGAPFTKSKGKTFPL